QMLTFMPALGREQRLALVQQLLAFAYSLKDQLREAPMSAELKTLAGDEPMCTEKRLLNFSRALLGAEKEQQVSDILRSQLDEQCSRLSAVQGGCERIKSTPIPYSYILMLHRTVHIYCFLLPFCLVDS